VSAPSVPSEPSASARRSGPAALAGTSRVASAPAGAAIRSEATSSSKRPKPVDACPAERVAAQPPTVAHS
jgi:hypothetical protein